MALYKSAAIPFYTSSTPHRSVHHTDLIKGSYMLTEVYLLLSGFLPPAVCKKAKRSIPLSHVTAEGRAKQFKSDLYADGGVLFCCFFFRTQHHFTRIDTVKEHLKSKKHVAKKEAKTRSSDVPSTSRQITLGSGKVKGVSGRVCP